MANRSGALALCSAVFVACSPPQDGDEAFEKNSQAIQGGTLDSGDPAVVAIMISTNQGIAICSGSLIAPNLVLTAHHCVADVATTACSNSAFGTTYAATAFSVTTSPTSASTYFNGGGKPAIDNTTWFGVSKVWVPGANMCGDDMALLELSTKVPSSVCPLVPRVDSTVTLGEAYTAVGFGVTSPTGQSAGKRYTVAGVSVICVGNTCGGMSPTKEWEGGSSAARGVCEGDSGGPALDSLGRVIGTVSRGPGNACNDAVYESVYGNGAWIKAQGLIAATDGQYTALAWATGGSTATPPACAGGAGGGSGSSGTGGGTGTGTGGGSGGSTGGQACTNAALTCVDASGTGVYACLDPNTASGFPSGAASCTRTSDCPTGYGCWQSGTSARCLQACVPGSGTGGGTGTGGGGSTGIGSGGSTGAGGGTAGTGGATGTGGGTSAPAGTGGGSAGSGGAGGGSTSPAPIILPLADAHGTTSCSATGSTGWPALAFLAALVLRPRRRSTARA